MTFGEQLREVVHSEVMLASPSARGHLEEKAVRAFRLWLYLQGTAWMPSEQRCRTFLRAWLKRRRMMS